MSRPLTRRRLLQGAGMAGLALGGGTVGGVSPAAVRSVEGKDPLRGLDRTVRKAMTDWGVPGLAVAVVKDGRTVLARGYGIARHGEKKPVTEQTVFSIGSVTKTFTSACLAILVDDGKLHWDDPVTKHLPGFQLHDPWVTREITLRDLLCHRSGLPLGNMLWQNGAFDREEILRRLRYLRLTSSFRSRFGYQNLLYLAAGQVVARVSGKIWEDFVTERVFRPLEMSSSSATTRAFTKKGNAAAPHLQLDGRLRTIQWLNRELVGPAGSISASVTDLSAWLKVHLAEGKHERGRLFSATTAREMHTPQTIIPVTAGDGKVYPKQHFNAYGLGWFVRDYRGRKLVEHSGTFNGFVAWIAFMPERQFGLAILANLHETGINYALRHTILDAYLGEPERDWSTLVKNDYQNGYQKALREGRQQYAHRRVKETRPSLAIAEYAGAYESDLYGKIEVREKGGKLSLRYGVRFVGSMDHWHYNTFRVTFENPILKEWMITFALDDRGRVKTLHAQEAPWAPSYMETSDLGEFRRVT
jgi:CubicO group peptidase (beta-lactamase class C family)